LQTPADTTKNSTRQHQDEFPRQQRSALFRVVPSCSFFLFRCLSNGIRYLYQSVPPCSAAFHHSISAAPSLLLLFMGINSLVLKGVTDYISTRFTLSVIIPGIVMPTSCGSRGFQRMSLASSFPFAVRIQPSRRDRSASLYSFNRSSVRAVMLMCGMPAYFPVLMMNPAS
jgi:hypothetical protein